MNALPVRMCCFATLLLLLGCAHRLQFCVIDASSGNALPCADVTVRRVTSFTYFQRKPNEREIGSTDINGVIIVTGITASDIVSFQAKNYFGAVVALVENNQVRINSPISPPMTPWVTARQILTNRDGIIVIPLMSLLNRQ